MSEAHAARHVFKDVSVVALSVRHLAVCHVAGDHGVCDLPKHTGITLMGCKRRFTFVRQVSTSRTHTRTSAHVEGLKEGDPVELFQAQGELEAPLDQG